MIQGIYIFINKGPPKNSTLTTLVINHRKGTLAHVYKDGLYNITIHIQIINRAQFHFVVYRSTGKPLLYRIWVLTKSQILQPQFLFETTVLLCYLGKG
jgi:hypothetical protein